MAFIGSAAQFGNRTRWSGHRSSTPRTAVMVMTPEKSAALKELKSKLEAELEDEISGRRAVDSSIYAKDVLFMDPLNKFRGVEQQEKNIKMLVGSPIIQSEGMKLHDTWIDEEKEAVMTRWTLMLRFKILPWKPVASFTGTSEYGMNDDLLVERHIDKWDSVRKQTFSLEAVSDLISEFTRDEAFDEEGDVCNYALLRRDVRGFEIRRICAGPVALCAYTNRGAGMNVLDSYFNGVNEEMASVLRLRPLILNFPRGLDDTESKTMFSFIGNSASTGRSADPPASGVAAVVEKPPRSNLEQVTIENFKEMRVATASFKEAITPQVAKSLEKQLQRILDVEGYERASDQVLFAQYGQVYTVPWARRNEIWIPLKDDI